MNWVISISSVLNTAWAGRSHFKRSFFKWIIESIKKACKLSPQNIYWYAGERRTYLVQKAFQCALAAEWQVRSGHLYLGSRVEYQSPVEGKSHALNQLLPYSVFQQLLGIHLRADQRHSVPSGKTGRWQEGLQRSIFQLPLYMIYICKSLPWSSLEG